MRKVPYPSKRVHFARGAHAATLRGQVSRDEAMLYVSSAPGIHREFVSAGSRLRFKAVRLVSHVPLEKDKDR